MPTLGELVKGKSIHWIEVGKSVFDAAKYMAQNNIGAVPVFDGDKLVGVFSEREKFVGITPNSHENLGCFFSALVPLGWAPRR